jgi:hypothetical protein
MGNWSPREPESRQTAEVFIDNRDPLLGRSLPLEETVVQLNGRDAE